MKKILLLICVFTISTMQAQYNQDAPWMKDLNVEQRQSSNPVTFQEIVDAFNTYWETRDQNVKGSGFKPFKRWENYWENFVKEDGTLPTSAELWNTWQQVVTKKNSSRMIDESDWQPVGPFTHTNTGSWSSGQGRVNSVTVDPSTIGLAMQTYYAGAPAGGIWKSTDSGASWEPLSDYLPQIGVSGIAVSHDNPQVIYIATGDDDGGDTNSVGVMKSIDGGETWQETGLNPSNTPFSMNDIYIHPTNANTLWVATNNGVYKSINGGATWSNSGNNTNNIDIKDIKLKPNNPNVIYAVSNGRFYKSINGGDTFNLNASDGIPTSGIGRMVIDVTPDNNEVVYALAAGTDRSFSAIYKSVDSGNSFISLDVESSGDIFDGSGQAFYDMAFAVSDVDENDIYVGVLNVWKGTVNNENTGAAFNRINQWNAPFQSSYTHADIHLLRFFNGSLFAGTDGGLYRSTNGGSSFSDLTGGMQIGQFYRVAVSKQTSSKMVGGLQDNGGHALNSGQWQVYYGADGMDTAVDPNNSNLYYGFTQFGGTLNISNAAGANLSSQVGSPDSGNWVTPLVINSESELYAGYGSLYKLNGSSWEPVSRAFSENVRRLEIDDLNPDNIYLTLGNILRKSTNRGGAFTSIFTFPQNITSIEVNTNNSDIVYVTTTSQVYRSINGGTSFTNITGSLPGVTKNVIKHQNLHSQNPLFLGTSLGVFRYDDSSGNWELFNNDLPNVTVTDIEINVNDNIITAATYGRGIWQSNIPTELATNDIRLIEVNGIGTSIQCNSSIAPQILVENNGVNIITEIDVTYTINGVDNNFTWTGSLASAATTLIDLPTINFDLGINNFTASTTIANDAYSINNDSETYTIYANVSGLTNDVNEFESVAEELLVFDEGLSTQYWEIGIPNGTVLNNGSGDPLNQVYGTNLNGDHDNNIKSFLVTNCYDLTTITSPELKFDMAFELEFNWDIIYVEYSVDFGENWNVLGSDTDLNWYNSNTLPGSNCFNCPGAQWTGTESEMTEYRYNLDAFESEENIMFRFVFQSDQAVVEEGVIIDNVVIAGDLLSVDEFNINNVSISPNPSSNIFNIKLKGNSNIAFDVYDVTGKLIIKRNNVVLSNNQYKLDMSKYASGVYFLNLHLDNRRITKKLILN